MKKLLFLFSLVFLTSCTSLNNNTTEVSTENNNSSFAEIKAESINFNLDKENNTNIYIESEPYLVTVKYPQTGYDNVNSFFDDWAKEKIKNFRLLSSSNNENNKELNINFEQFTFENKTDSFKFNIFTNDGLENRTTIETKTINNETGEIFYFRNETEDEQNLLNNLSKTIISYFNKNNLSELVLDKNMLLTGLEPKPENYNNFTLDNDNVVFYFDESVIGKTSNGLAIQIPVPTKEFFDLCKDVYPEIRALRGPDPEINNEFKDETVNSEFNDNVVDDTTTPLVQNKKFIALTFDDGPHAKNTVFLLDELKKTNAKVSFFLVGSRIEDNQEIIKRMYDEGHELGNHTYSHLDLRNLPYEEIKGQIESTNEAVFNITGEKPSSLRTPYGVVNDDIKNISKDNSMSLIMWDIDPLDWKYKDATLVKNHIVENVKNGDIILLHDMYTSSVEGAVMAINELSQQGYEFVTVSELLTMNNGQLTSGEVYYNASLE